MSNSKEVNKIARKRRVRARLDKKTPRMSVFCSNKHIFVQIIDDATGKTLVSSSDILKGKKLTGKKTEIASLVGKDIGDKAKTKKIKKIVFDRGSKLYHGRVAALAEAARKSGLEF